MAKEKERTEEEYRQLAQKHPLTYELATGSVHGMIKLATVGGQAPPSVRPWIGEALNDLTQLNLYAMTTLEEADDACIDRIEKKVKERWAAVQQEVEKRPEFTLGHGVQNFFGLEDRKRRIGFEMPADLPNSNR